MTKTISSEPWKFGINLPASMEFMNSNGGIDPASQGYQYVIQTTTQIAQGVIDQVFYKVPFAKYMPVDVGMGAFMEAIVKNVNYESAGNFEQGLTKLSAQNTIPEVTAALNPVTTPIYSWNKGYQYSFWEVRKALAADNWDPIEAKYKTLVENWQIGIQQVSYLGLQSDPVGAAGLLSQPNVTINMTLITQYINSMSPQQLSNLVAGLLAAYFANSNSTESKPTHFAIPMQDFLGLGAPWSPQFPNISILSYLKKAFIELTGNPNFEIYGVAYADQANNAGILSTLGSNRYVLYKNNPDSGKMYLPLDMVINAPATANNFQWQGVAAGQFTGFQAYRAPEFLYFDW